MMTDVVPCKRVTAEHIHSMLKTRQYEVMVPLVARQTATFPPTWTEDNAVEFTRVLRECDQRVMQFMIRTSVLVSVAKDFLDLLGDLQLPRKWLRNMQQHYPFLHKCLDIGQPVVGSKIPGLDLGHYAIIKTHPNATPGMLKGCNLAALLHVKEERTYDWYDSPMGMMPIFVFVTFMCMLLAILIAAAVNEPRTQQCPEPEPCPGLEAYHVSQLLDRVYVISDPIDIAIAIILGFIALPMKIAAMVASF